MRTASRPSAPATPDQVLKISAGHSFCSTGLAAKTQYLFTVTPGIAAHDAARSLCELLEALSEPIYATAMSERDFSARDAWLAKHTLDAAKAVANAIAHALEEC